MKKSLATLVRDSSARSFSLQMTLADGLSSALLGLVAGCAAFVFGSETAAGWRLAAAVQAAVAAGACFVIVRSLVPLALSLSFADMLRLKTAFYFWAVSLVVLVGACPVTRAVFASFGGASASLTLTFAAIALTVRFLQGGSLLTLTLAFVCAGLASGVSAFGLVATAIALGVMKVVAFRLFRNDDSPWQDTLAPGMVDYFTNPLVRSRMGWLLTLCFVASAALSFCSVRLDFTPDVVKRLRTPWDYGVSLDGAVFFLATAVLPFVVAVSKSRRASDVFERLGGGKLLGYFAVAAFSALMLVNPALLLVVSGVPLRVETAVVVLSCLFYAYNVLLSVTCILIDVRCRDYRDVEGVRAGSLRGVVQAVYALACLAPLALVALVFAFLFR